jgi:hypothetical protein
LHGFNTIVESFGNLIQDGNFGHGICVALFSTGCDIAKFFG